MNHVPASVGMALSGGSVRGLAHIGVFKTLTERGIAPDVIAGTSAGSLIGACIAAGLSWRDIAGLAESIYWPDLLDGEKLERFCETHLPATFDGLAKPFAAVAVDVATDDLVVMRSGPLATAISASCALPWLRRPVERDGRRLTDGGVRCVLPTDTCRRLGGNFVIASDVWGFGAWMRSLGFFPTDRRFRRFYQPLYRRGVRTADVLIRPDIPIRAHVPGREAVELMVRVGEAAASEALDSEKNVVGGWMSVVGEFGRNS